jgi:hypothetical protein
MNNFVCKCGKSYKFSSGLSAHKKKCNDVLASKTDNKIDEKSRVNELEYELKLKNDEIKNIYNEFQLLKEQLTKPVSQPVLQPVSKPVKKSRTKLSTIEYLENNFKNAIPIEECHYLFLKCENNKCLHEEQFAGKDGVNKNIINQKYLLESNFTDSTSGNAMDIIADLFLKIDKTKFPFYCSDKHRNTLYIKTNTGWIKSTERDFDKTLFTFIKYALWSVSNSVINTINIFKIAPSKFKEIYNKTYEDWLRQDKPDLLKKLIILEEETEDKKLSVKKLKILMAKMSITGDNDETDEEPEA